MIYHLYTLTEGEINLEITRLDLVISAVGRQIDYEADDDNLKVLKKTLKILKKAYKKLKSYNSI